MTVEDLIEELKKIPKPTNQCKVMIGNKEIRKIDIEFSTSGTKVTLR